MAHRQSQYPFHIWSKILHTKWLISHAISMCPKKNLRKWFTLNVWKQHIIVELTNIQSIAAQYCTIYFEVLCSRFKCGLQARMLSTWVKKPTIVGQKFQTWKKYEYDFWAINWGTRNIWREKKTSQLNLDKNTEDTFLRPYLSHYCAFSGHSKHPLKWSGICVCLAHEKSRASKRNTSAKRENFTDGSKKCSSVDQGGGLYGGGGVWMGKGLVWGKQSERSRKVIQKWSEGCHSDFP